MKGRVFVAADGGHFFLTSRWPEAASEINPSHISGFSSFPVGGVVEGKMTDNSGTWGADQADLSMNTTRAGGYVADGSDMEPQTIFGHPSATAGEEGGRLFVPSSLDSLQGSQMVADPDTGSRGIQGGDSQPKCAAGDLSAATEVSKVPNFNNLLSMRFVDGSGNLEGIVGSLDTGANPIRAPPKTGSFVYGPLVYASIWHDQDAMAIIRNDAKANEICVQLQACKVFWGLVWPHSWDQWIMTIGTSPKPAVREARVEVAKKWIAGGVQDLMWLAPIVTDSIRMGAGQAPYLPAFIQEVCLQALSDEQQTALYACVAFAFGSPPDGGAGGTVTLGSRGFQVVNAQEATVNPANYMVYSDDAREWQPFQTAEIEANGSVNIGFSNGRWITVTHSVIRPIDRSQVGRVWNESIFGPRLATAHHPRPPAPMGLTAMEFRGLTEALETARSPEMFLQRVQQMSLTARKALERTFALRLGESDRVRAVAQVMGLGMPAMRQSLLKMQEEGSIILEASPTVRLNKIQRTAQYTTTNIMGGARVNL